MVKIKYSQVFSITLQVFRVDMFLHQQWNDHRLNHSMNEKLTIIVGMNGADIIWTPDTLLLSSIESQYLSDTVNSHRFDIYPNGDVYWGTRYF